MMVEKEKDIVGRCQGCGLDLSDQAWDADHIVALINWIGEGHVPQGASPRRDQAQAAQSGAGFEVVEIQEMRERRRDRARHGQNHKQGEKVK